MDTKTFEYIILEDRRWNKQELKLLKTVTANNETEARNKVFRWLIDNQGCSVDCVLKDQGYYVLLLNNDYYLNKK